MARCLACGRRLRRPSLSGLGPVCARRLGVTVVQPARASPAAAGDPLSPAELEAAGQLAIPIQPPLTA